MPYSSGALPPPREASKHSALRRQGYLVLSPTAWVTIERLTQQMLWLVFLAPILGPRPYGLYTIVMVFVGFSELVLIESATEALVTVDKLDNLHATTANLAAGAIGPRDVPLRPCDGVLFHDDEITVWCGFLLHYQFIGIVGATDCGSAAIPVIQAVGRSLDRRFDDWQYIRNRPGGCWRWRLGTSAASACPAGCGVHNRMDIGANSARFEKHPFQRDATGLDEYLLGAADEFSATEYSTTHHRLHGQQLLQLGVLVFE